MGHQTQRVILVGLGVLLAHLWMHQTMEQQKAKLERDRQSWSLAAGGCSKAHPQAGKGRVLQTYAHQCLTLSILCSPCTYCVSENPI